MEFNYELGLEKSLRIAKERMSYAYHIKEKTAKIYFGICLVIPIAGLILSLSAKDYLFVIVHIALLILLVLLLLKLEVLLISAERKKIKLLFQRHKKPIIKNIIINNKEIFITTKLNQKIERKVLPLSLIRHIKYSKIGDGILLSPSKLARYVYFIDLSNLDEKDKESFINDILESLKDERAIRELSDSLK